MVADSAEPKSIRELRDDGWDVRPAPKGQDSVRHGIDALISKDVSYTEESENIDYESHEYKFGHTFRKGRFPCRPIIDTINYQDKRPPGKDVIPSFHKRIVEHKKESGKKKHEAAKIEIPT